MKRALPTLLVAFACSFASACAKQDATLLVKFDGPFQIPRDADQLDLDVFDGTADIKHASYPLTAQTPLPVSVSIVQSGAQHPHVKINAKLSLTGQAVALGTTLADFQSGSTVDVTVLLVSPQ